MQTIEILGRAGFDEFRAIDDGSFPRHSLNLARPVGARTVRRPLQNLLTSLAPDVVVVPGWAMPESLVAIEWGIRFKKPLVVMSCSNQFDKSRAYFQEMVKTKIIQMFSGGLVGGKNSLQYLISLGMDPRLIRVGYNVIDNGHFINRQNVKGASLRGINDKFFLASARFVEKKNLQRLLDAFAIYLRMADKDVAWQLVVLGDGELRPELERYKDVAGLGDKVIFPGYKNYGELPEWYGAASCFIHASTTEQWGLVVNEAMAAALPVLVSARCGCAADLVQEGVNGFSFDPYGVEQIASLMHRMAHGDVDSVAMGNASREIIADWGPERFAEGLEKAVEAALAAPPRKPTLLDKALLWALIRR